MAKLHWKERFGKDGICDFKANFDFYFKWLLSKTASCLYIKGLPDTVDEFYVKSNLLVDGDICFTDFGDSLYALCGAPGGQPDEYYKPTLYTVANPILGSKIVKDGIDGVIVYNTPLDAYVPGGLYGLISQTSTLLADNIISINCCQINSRVTAMVTADSDAQAQAGEIILKSVYAGHPYKIMRSDMLEKINVNPIAQTGLGGVITELVELHNYIISNYFQSIGIKANNVRKNAHVLQDEIDVQNDYLQISILEIMTSWQEGFDKVNKMFGTDIHVELNPALLDILIGSDNDDSDNSSNPSPDMDDNDNSDVDITEDVSKTSESELVDNVDSDNDSVDNNNDSNVLDTVTKESDTVEELVDMINDKGGDDNVSDERSDLEDSKSEDVE